MRALLVHDAEVEGRKNSKNNLSNFTNILTLMPSNISDLIDN